MPPIKDVRGAAVTDFMLENYEKEKILRVKWNHEHKELIDKAAGLRREPTNYSYNSINKSVIIAGMSNITRESITGSKNRITKPVKDYLLIENTNKPVEASMKPVEKENCELIKESKVKYLKVRNFKAPEEKYNYIEATSWRYGWELKKSAQKNLESHGRKCLLMHARQGRSGPHRDPDHYNSPETYKHTCTL